MLHAATYRSLHSCMGAEPSTLMTCFSHQTTVVRIACHENRTSAGEHLAGFFSWQKIQTIASITLTTSPSTTSTRLNPGHPGYRKHGHKTTSTWRRNSSASSIETSPPRKLSGDLTSTQATSCFRSSIRSGAKLTKRAPLAQWLKGFCHQG